MNLKSILLLIILGLFIIICIQNVEDVSINILFWSSNISKLLLLILTLIIGIIIGIIIQGFWKKPKVENNTIK
jgi:uncharacterized integral membrane protein